MAATGFPTVTVARVEAPDRKKISQRLVPPPPWRPPAASSRRSRSGDCPSMHRASPRASCASGRRASPWPTARRRGRRRAGSCTASPTARLPGTQKSALVTHIHRRYYSEGAAGGDGGHRGAHRSLRNRLRESDRPLARDRLRRWLIRARWLHGIGVDPRCGHRRLRSPRSHLHVARRSARPSACRAHGCPVTRSRAARIPAKGAA